MIARMVKTLRNKHDKDGLSARPHREHRSKKGRSFRPDIQFTRTYKKKLEALKVEELELEAKKLNYA